MSGKNSISVFAPASVSNVACGFDILGFALNGLGDTISVTRNVSSSELTISSIVGPGSERIPRDSDKNTATAAARALLNAAELNYGFDFQIEKGVMPGSGLGSSASSAVAAVYAVNALLGNPFKVDELLEFAGKGEELSTENIHLDNVAASLMGGFILVRSQNPPDIIPLSYSDKLQIIAIHPQIEISTQFARSIMPETLDLDIATSQWANLAAFVTALQNHDVKLMRRSMIDNVAEPVRKRLIPEYENIKAIALDNGAIGSNISGSGPAIFCITDSIEVAEKITEKVKQYVKSSSLEINIYNTSISNHGARILGK